MTDSVPQAQVAAARAYESLFVDALFRQWAPHVAAAARVGPGQRVLDVACGTGILARTIGAEIGDDGYVAGLDPNPAMLAVAREIAPSIDWRQGLAEAIPFPDRSFDAVVSQFGFMFFRDRHRALREMLRVLTPGGTLAVAVWDGLAHVPAYAIEVALVERLAGASAGDALRAPFALGDRQGLSALFADGGAASVRIETRRGTAHFPSVRVMVEADLRGWLPVMGVDLPEPLIDTILQEADTALRPYVGDDGNVTFDIGAHIVSASRQ